MANSDDLEYVNRGDNVVQAMTASRFNAYTDAANWYKRINQEADRKYSEIKDRPALIDVVATAGFSRLDVLGLDSIGIPFADRDETIEDIFRPDFSGVIPTATHRGKFAIALQDVEQIDDVGTAAAAGVYAVRLFVESNGDWINRADVDTTDATRLRALPNGSAQILWKEAGTNTEVNAIVRLGNPEFVALPGKANGPIVAGSTGTVRIWQNTTTDTGYDISGVLLDWMAGGLDISNGKEVLIGWFPDEQLWRVIGAECEDTAKVRAVGQLQDDSTALTPQSLTTTPVPWNNFAVSEELGTPNVTLNSAAATIQLPDVTDPNGDVYNYSYTGILTPGSNNNTYSVEATVNGVLNGFPLLIDGRQSGTSLSFSFSGKTVVPTGSAPVIGLTIAMASGTDTINWNGGLFLLDRDTDF